MNEERLTSAELQALLLLSQGATAAGVARIMGISESTLGRVLRRVRRKLGAESTIQAVSIAIRTGLI
ncbi:MAG: LuxR C-terminal-related transcriptional regulator [Actinomycetota bacterium]